jgi:radical SAM superfamily enzyme YgiQ (UPF0313 family)
MIPQFEIGNIYPPNEKDSVKLRVTKGCTWNTCAFCTSYLDEDFKFRGQEDVVNDLNAIRFLLDSDNDMYKETYFYKEIEDWNGNVFLGDSDAILHPNLRNLVYLVKSILPESRRVSTYASVSNILSAYGDNYKDIDRIYSGFETGSDAILKLMNKQHSADRIEEAYRRCSDKDLHLHLILGLGGKDFSEIHREESVELINKILPDCVEFRTIQVEPGSRLEDLQELGFWIEPSEEDLAEELKFFKENIDPIIELDILEN